MQMKSSSSGYQSGTKTSVFEMNEMNQADFFDPSEALDVHSNPILKVSLF